MADDIIQEEEIPVEDMDIFEEIDEDYEETPEEGPDFDKDEMIPTDD